MIPQFGDYSSIRYRNGKTECFDYRERQYHPAYSYTKKQKRIFHNTFSGLQVGFHKKQRLIFLTLTTEYDVTKKAAALAKAERELNNHWQLFKKNLDYQVQKWRFDEWFKATYNVNIFTPEGMKFYRERKKNAVFDKRHTMFEHFKFKLCYLKVRTTEGGGVIHALIRKNRDIPILAQKFLKDLWDRIHGAEQVQIEEIKQQGENLQDAMNASFYFCGNYFNQQPVVRQSSSYNWIFRGAAAAWVRGKKILGIKRELKERAPSKEHEDQYGVIWKTSHIEKKPNIIMERKSMIQLFMNSRKSGEGHGTEKPTYITEWNQKSRSYINKKVIFKRISSFICRKDSGYDNALYQWLLLVRHPPIDTRQLKLKKYL